MTGFAILLMAAVHQCTRVRIVLMRTECARSRVMLKGLKRPQFRTGCDGGWDRFGAADQIGQLTAPEHSKPLARASDY